MEPKFKIGDWVTLVKDNNFIGKITNVGSETYTINKDAVWFHTTCGLWQPKPGEWCWFWDYNTPHRPTFREFGRITEDCTGDPCYWDSEQNPYTNIEPFTGKPPTHLDNGKYVNNIRYFAAFLSKSSKNSKKRNFKEKKCN